MKVIHSSAHNNKNIESLLLMQLPPALQEEFSSMVNIASGERSTKWEKMSVVLSI